MALLSNQFNNSSREQQVDPGNVVNFRYFDIEQIQSLKFPQKEKSLSFFHINTCSLNKYLYAYLLKCTNKNFDIIAISETRTLKITSLTSNFRLKIYFFWISSNRINSRWNNALSIQSNCNSNHELALICIKQIN